MSTNDGRRTPIAWPTLGIVGVTGAVGRVVLDVQPMRDPHWGRIRLAAGEEDVGSVCRVNGEDVVVEALEPAFFDGIDVAIFDIPPEIAQEWVEMAASRGVVAIDNSTAFRTRDDVPLVVPEVNSHKAVDRPRGIIANPGATVMTMIDALAVLHAVWELTGLVVTTLQAASGRGRAGMSRLYDEIEVVQNLLACRISAMASRSRSCRATARSAPDPATCAGSSRRSWAHHPSQHRWRST